MVYCTHCADYCPYIKDPDKGYICCGTCGKVLDQDIYSDEPTFISYGPGQSRVEGTPLRSIEIGTSLSHERTLMKGMVWAFLLWRDEIWQIVTSLHVGGGDTIIDMAHKIYTLAVDHNFTRGRRTTQVAAACLYIASGVKNSPFLSFRLWFMKSAPLTLCIDIHFFLVCSLTVFWQSKKAYLLIDFSDYLKISVYVLGAVFLQLCQVLLLAEHPIVQKLIDPSLFIHRFTERIQPPNYTKSDIFAVVHICEATLTKRLIEFENTDSGSLMIEDFLAKADEEQPSHKSGEVLCKHKDKDAEHLAHGLCEKCYNKFIKMSGGLEGGADPPAFQQAEKQRLEAAKKAEEAAAIKEAALGESNCEIQNSDVEDNMICPMKEQAAKEALAAELAARGVRVGGGQPKKRRRNEDTKNLSPAETPAEATYNMLKQKGLGSKINIEAVGGLYDTKDEDGEADEKGDMGFDGEYTQDIGDGETFEGGYDYADYNNNGYGGAGDYTDHDDF
ncbi:hypothetical protein BRADI_1g41808v3 [Brachypodium distachyon]|uniref:Cyclin-like domain-containing protein n=1 Tax=Brachypodium distachyon TaxID=15368 RepID=A0A0Q3S089_BRADI|nr:hypothetical protein BRADI_1g41808v3 [Brachypodium distachyon]